MAVPNKKSPLELRNVAINLAAGGSAGKFKSLRSYKLLYSLLSIVFYHWKVIFEVDLLALGQLNYPIDLNSNLNPRFLIIKKY